MKNVSVDMEIETLYKEPDNRFYNFTRHIKLRNVLNLIKTYRGDKQKFSLLEIGTGSGYLMSFLEKKYPEALLYGIEYDYRLVEFSKKKIENAQIFQGNAESFDFNGKKFDFIVSLQVIEHLFHPEIMLECVKKNLSSNGYLIITTPNTECIASKYMKNKWHGYRADHVSMKSFTEWKDFMEQNGFCPIYCGSTFFTGIPILNKFPLGLINWGLLFIFGSIKWKYGESFIGVFKLSQ